MGRPPELPNITRTYPRPSVSERATRWIRTHRIETWLVSMALIILALALLVTNLDTVLIALHLKTDKSLALAGAGSRDEISRNLVKIAWRRMYWARVFVFRLNANAPQPEIDSAWVRFNDASAEWNENLMINIKALAEYYPHTKKREQFEFDIQGRWLGISQILFDLRYRTPKDPVALRNMIDDVQARMDTLNNLLYEFVLGEPSPRARK